MTTDPMAGHIRCRSCASAVPVDALPLFQGVCPYCLGRPKPYETRTVPAPAPLEAVLEKTERKLRPVDELAPGTPAEIVSIIHKCLSHKPGDRYSSAAEISEDLRRWRTGHAVDAHSRGWIYRAWRFVTRRRWAVAAVILGFWIAAAAVAIEIQRRHVEEELKRGVAEKWSAAGQRCIDLHDDAGAIEAFTNAIALDPKPDTYVLRSFANWRLMKMHACLTDSLIATVMDPTNAAARYWKDQAEVYIGSH